MYRYIAWKSHLSIFLTRGIDWESTSSRGIAADHAGDWRCQIRRKRIVGTWRPGMTTFRINFWETKWFWRNMFQPCLILCNLSRWKYFLRVQFCSAAWHNLCVLYHYGMTALYRKHDFEIRCYSFYQLLVKFQRSSNTRKKSETESQPCLPRCTVGASLGASIVTCLCCSRVKISVRASIVSLFCHIGNRRCPSYWHLPLYLQEISKIYTSPSYN